MQGSFLNSHIFFLKLSHPIQTMKNDAVIRGMLNYCSAIKVYESTFYPSLCIVLFIFIYS